jgi:hypothetical protein
LNDDDKRFADEVEEQQFGDAKVRRSLCRKEREKEGEAFFYRVL